MDQTRKQGYIVYNFQRIFSMSISLSLCTTFYTAIRLHFRLIADSSSHLRLRELSDLTVFHVIWISDETPLGLNGTAYFPQGGTL